MAKDADVEALMALRLTSLQARVYLAVAKLGEAKTSEISKHAGVARQDIYRLMDELHELGLIEQVLTTPVRHRAIPVKEAATVLLQRIHEERARSMEKALKLVERHGENHARHEARATLEEKEKLVCIPKKETLINKMKKSIEADRVSIDLTCPWRLCTQALEDLSPFYQEALERGVRIRWVTDKPLEEIVPETVRRIAAHPLFELRVVDSSPGVIFGIHDKKEVHIALGSPTQYRYDDRSALWSNMPPFVHLAQYYFDSLWNEASPPPI